MAREREREREREHISIIMRVVAESPCSF